MPDVIDNVKVGQLIKKLLKERKMTQEELANRLSISKSAVSQNVNGKSSFDIQNLMKISEIFNISLDELISHKAHAEGDVISEYERLVKKGLKELKRVNPRNLNIKEPDLYGKVLIEYVIDYEKADMFKYLVDADVVLFNPHHHQARDVALKIIIFMLKKNIPGVEQRIYDYTRFFGMMSIPDEKQRETIMRLLDDKKRQPIVRALMTEKVSKDDKICGIIPIKRHIRVLTKKQWLERIALYQMESVLDVYMDIHDIHDDYALIIETFCDHRYAKGCHRLMDTFKKQHFPKGELKRMKAQAMAKRVAELNDLALFKKVIEKGLYYDINDLIRSLIYDEHKSMFDWCLKKDEFSVDYERVMLAAVDKGNHALLADHIHKLTQNQKDFLLSRVSTYDFDTLDLLLREGARFVTKYHNRDTYAKVNHYIREILKKDEEAEEDA